ncbi:hypothetical protein OY671_011610, partial [Metschnikowia pulcherrima]
RGRHLSSYSRSSQRSGRPRPSRRHHRRQPDRRRTRRAGAPQRRAGEPAGRARIRVRERAPGPVGRPRHPRLAASQRRRAVPVGQQRDGVRRHRAARRAGGHSVRARPERPAAGPQRQHRARLSRPADRPGALRRAAGSQVRPDEQRSADSAAARADRDRG